MKKLIYAVAGTAIIAFSACNMNYKTTKSGLKYKILSGKATHVDTVGVAVTAGNIVKFNLKYSIPENKDTVIRNSYGEMPLYAQVDTTQRAEMSIMEILPKMKTGDSAEVLISVDSIMSKSGGQAPPFMKKGQHIKAVISLLNSFKDETLAKADVDKEQAKQKLVDDVKLKTAGEALDKYISDKGIKAIKTKNGVYIVLDNPGDISKKANSGMVASVKYTGTLLDGTVFDSNIDSTVSGHGEPIDMPVGEHRAIEGWDEALPYFGKGAIGKVYIPASLAYGARATGKIPAYSNLVFEIHVLDVKKPEAQPATAAPSSQSKMTPEMQKQLQEQIQKQMQAQQQGAGH